MSGLRIHLLGPPHVALEDVTVEIRRRKGMALLAYLAVTGEMQRRDTLATMLWPDSSQRNARATLRRDLWILKQSLGKEWFVIGREAVALRHGPALWLDVERFQQLLVEGQPSGHLSDETEPPDLATLTKAVKLYRGDFLTGFTLSNCPDFDEWQFFQTEKLRQAFATALQRLIRAHSAQGDPQAAIPYARRWLALNSLHESAHGQLMQLYAQTGQRAAALRQYQLCVRTLQEELGISPDQETTALYEYIRSGGMSKGAEEQGSRGDLATPLRRRSVTPSNHNLPSQLTPFIGRKDELAAITRRLQDPDCRLLTLVGPGGMGKTRLAIQAAQNLIDIQSKGITFAYGVIFVPLSPVSSPGGLISAIAEAADFCFYSDVSPRQQLLDYLREKEMLLVLDNFETDADLITEILATAPAVRILVTSREALNLQEAWFHPVDGMSFPKEGIGEGKALEEYDAIRLFVQSARRAQVGFSLAAEQQSVARICRLVEGIPLAIELAATWLKVLSCDEIAREIEHSLGFLATQHTDVPERHRSMRAVFEHSWRLLAEAEQDVLKRLSVFRGGFRQDAAESVVGALLIILRTLVEKSLLRPTDSGRYQMHELLRQFAAEKIESDLVEKRSTQARHSRYYLTFLQVQEQSLKGEQQQTALVEIGKEIENVRAGWNWAVEQGQVDAIDRALESLYNFYQIRGRYQEGGETFGYAVQHVRGPNNQANPQKFKTLQAKILARWGAFDASLGFTEPAKERLQKSLSIVRELGHQQEIAFCLDFLGRVAGWQGHYAGARQLLQESLSISKAIDEREGMVITMNNLAEVVQFLGEYSEAKRLAQDSLDISRELGRRDWIAYALDRLGFNTFILGEYAESEQYYQESLTIFKELGDQLGISLTLIAPGLIAWATGGANLVEAETLAQKSLAVARECGHRFHIATRLGLLGLIVSDSGRLEDARQIYQEGLTISKALDAAVPMVNCLSGLGDVNRQLGNLQASKKYLLKALKTGVNAGLLGYTLQALVYYAALLLQESDVLEKRPALKRQKQIQALELVALTLHHPACWQAFKERAARLRTRLEAELASKVAAATWERGKSRTLEDVVSEILVEQNEKAGSGGFCGLHNYQPPW